MNDFDGAKIALVNGDGVLVIQRDNKPGLRFADMWDFPGGGREGSETAFECVKREVSEELGIILKESSIQWTKTYPSMHDPNLIAYFMVATLSDGDVNGIIFGDEGQGWKMISFDEFMKDESVIAGLKVRFSDYINRS